MGLDRYLCLPLLLSVIMTLNFATISIVGVNGQTTGPRRGMYLSPWTSNTGAMNFLDPAQPELEQFSKVLGNVSKELIVLNWLRHYHFNVISLYDLNTIFDSGTKTANLRSFITRARLAGIEKIEAICGPESHRYDTLLTYQTGCSDDSQRFDGLVTEIEFWHDHEVYPVVNVLNYAKSLGLTAPFGGTFYYASYLGWVNTTEVNLLAPILDYMWFHAYVSNPSTAFSYTNGRISDLFAVSASVKVLPIFSTEGTAFKAGSEFFMGDWLGTPEGSLHAAETIYYGDYNETHKPSKLNRLAGYQWYAYNFCKMYLGDVSLTHTLPVATTPPGPTPPTSTAPATTVASPTASPVTGPTPPPTSTTQVTASATASGTTVASPTTAVVGTTSPVSTTSPVTSATAGTSSTETSGVSSQGSTTEPVLALFSGVSAPTAAIALVTTLFLLVV